EGRSIGRIVRDAGAVERYVEHVVSAAEGTLGGLRVVVDCANGGAFHLAPAALARLGADVTAVSAEPDGWNINDGCGATHPEVVGRAVVQVGADAGVAHDGDADRALFSDHLGRVVDGDPVLAALAADLHEHGELRGGLVVTTAMANLGFRRRMEEAGITTLETKVGDRYVLEEMLRSGAVLGGEQSGHVIFLRHATTGDGLLTAVQFLTLAARTGVTVADLAAGMTRYPQVLQNVPVADPGAVEGAEAVWRAVRAAEESLGRHGRVLVRPSGTEPVVRVMVEAETQEEAEAQAAAISEAVSEALGPARTGS
ncbi:MAG TPA: phosphoglucosamine mutase, partial [Actinomycetota bacterium]